MKKQDIKLNLAFFIKLTYFIVCICIIIVTVCLKIIEKNYLGCVIVIKDYFVNATILVAFVSILFQLLRSNGISPKIPLKYRAFVGSYFGFLGITLMIFSIKISNELIIDFRNLAIVLSAIYGGCITVVISGLIIAASRILIFGVNISSVLAVVVIIIQVLLFCIITRLKIKKQVKWFLTVCISEIVASIAFVILIDDQFLIYKVIFSYCLIFTIVSVLLYFYVGYIESLTASYRQLKQEATLDFLTGLNNVRQFDNIFNQVKNNIKLYNQRVSLLYIDIDFFKKVNDTYGHKEGDLVLKELGKILSKTCRSSDIVSRNGGEEFSVILLESQPELAIEIAELIRKKVESSFFELSDKAKIKITISIGVASYPESTNDIDILSKKADEALYEAKRTGRNKVVFSK